MTYQIETKTDELGGFCKKTLVLSEHADLGAAVDALVEEDQRRGCWIRRDTDSATLILSGGGWRLPSGAEGAPDNYGYEYKYPCELPDGWGLAIYPDGRAMVCPPETCPEELGGHALASSSREEALREARQFIRQL